MKPFSNFDRFKKEINLTQYAAHSGYEIDKKKSTRNSIAMRKGNEDKIIISRRNGHWLYFSVYDDTDRGSIVDFLQNRMEKSLPEIAQELEQWLDGTIRTHPDIQYIDSVEDKKTDPERIKRLFARCAPVVAHPYLEGRGIGPGILFTPRFQGTVYRDYYQNAVFPHFKNNKVCGLELKQENTSLFVRGSEKTLWQSNVLDNDDTMVIAEAAIDAISYQILFSLKKAFYVATSGGFSEQQENSIAALLSNRPLVSTVVLAVDNNAGGDRLYNRLFGTIHKADFNGRIYRHSPVIVDQDWNDVLNRSV